MSSKLIYLVEDERDIRDLACRALREHGYTVEDFSQGKSAQRAIKRCRPDLVVCDLGLPDMDGLTLVREFWQDPRIGVIILTGRGSLSDRVLGLEVGADDYITKPFEPRELVARVASLLRRMELSVQGGSQTGGKAAFAGWLYDPDTLTLVSPTGDSTTISAAEAHLLMVFLKAPNRVLSREQLLGEEARKTDQPSDRSIDVRVSRLRQKLQAGTGAPQLIKTVYGAGYLFATGVDWQS